MKLNFSKLADPRLKERNPYRLRLLPYPVYLATDHWKETRQKILKCSKFRCKECQATDNLHIHHLNYRRLGRERMKDLEVLCGDCHQRLHDEEYTF